eukprot:3519098-Ditylum_brightwellii.AAC.1
MADVKKKGIKERQCYVVENLECVCKLTCLWHHWYTLEVCVDAINLMLNPSPLIRTDELHYLLTRHPKYNAISDQENNIGLYTQRRKMKSLVAKGAARRKYRFYWCGNKGEYPQVMDQCYKKLDESSFSSCRGVRALNNDFDEEYKMENIDISKENSDNVIMKECEVVVEEENEGVPKVEMEEVLTGAKEKGYPLSVLANLKEILSKFESG